MKTVKIGELKNRLSSYLQYVRSGEEVVVCDRSVPVARILPFHEDAEWEHEAKLVASGAMTMPERQMDLQAFFSLPRAKVSQAEAVRAVIDSRGDW